MANKGGEKQPLEPLFKELDSFIQEEEFLKATKTCDKILAIAPNDPDALKCKVVAFIKLGQIPNALSVIDSFASDKKLAAEFLFEKAYCLYRNKKYEESLEVIKSIPKPYPVRVLELEAQVRYRMENYKQCIGIYEELVKQKVDSAELKTNLCAAYTEAGMLKESAFFVEKNKAAMQETFEFAFNAACAFIATGDFAKAESLLQVAKKVCTDSLTEDGYSPAEVQQELAVLQVQLAYCQQLAGQLDAAANLYAEVLKTKSNDQVAIAVATNNAVALKRGDPFDGMKRLRSAAPEAVEQKLTPAQRRTLTFNKTVLLLHTGKADQVKSALEQLEQSGSDPEGIVLLKASLLIKEKNADQAEKLLAEYSQKNPHSLAVPLSLAQIHLNKNAFAQTLAVLEGLGEEYKYKPGVVATISALYEKVGDIEGAGRALDKYVEWAEKQKDKLDGEQVAQILRLSGEFKFQHKKYEQAVEIFEKVLKKNRNDFKALAQLVLAASHFNPALAQKYEDRIPVSEENLDGAELEKLPAPSLRNKQVAAPAPGEEKQLKKKDKKKKRKPRLPKNHTPGVMPDPERWLPKWQRSYYKKKQKKQQLGKGSQGIATTGHQSVPLSAGPAKNAPAPSAKAAPASTASPTAKAQAKKGKKGKK